MEKENKTIKEIQSTLRDWRFASAGDDVAREELSEQQQKPWPVKIASWDDGLDVTLIDPVNGGEDRLDNQSMFVGFEINKGMPRLFVAPDGLDNLAVITFTLNSLVIEPQTGDKIIVIGQNGWQVWDRNEFDIASLDKSPVEDETR